MAKDLVFYITIISILASPLVTSLPALAVSVSLPYPGGTYSGGSGTDTDPYQISNTADWTELMGTSADWDKYFIMTADIDFGGASLTPVGKVTGTFYGIFDGDGHILSDAVINQPEVYNVGIFGYLGLRGQIRNLTSENIAVNGYSRDIFKFTNHCYTILL